VPGINDAIAVRGDGAPVTVLERAVDTLRVGGYISDAAARCGVTEATMHRWLRTGARLANDLLSGRRTSRDLTDEERDQLRFAQACAEAEAEGKAVLLQLSHRLSVGGIPVETVTIKEVEPTPAVTDAEGRIIRPAIPGARETTTKRETTLPDGQMIRWRLAARWPEHYGPRGRMEVTGEGGGPIEVADRTPVDALIATLSRMAAQQSAIDAASVEAPADTP
jgi:hypothetical protein